MKEPLTREQRAPIFYGVLCLNSLFVILQLWLLTATMNAYLGGDETIIVPTAIASLICFGMNVLLLRYISRIEQQRKDSNGVHFTSGSNRRAS